MPTGRGAEVLAGSLAIARVQAAKFHAASPATANASLPTVATLPDHGELTAPLLGVFARKEGAYTWRQVRISEAHAFASIDSGRMKVRAPTGELLVLEYDNHVEHASGDWTWIGHVAGTAPELGQVVLTFGAQAVFGEIAQTTRRAPPLRIATRGGRVWMGETSFAELAANPAPRPSPDYLIPEGKHAGHGAGIPSMAGAVTSVAVGADPSPNAVATRPTVDLLMAYTPGVMQHLGSASAAVTRMNYHVDFLNIILANSRVNGRVRLVHTAMVNYPDTTSMYDALYDLSGSNGHTVPPSLQPLHTLRDQVGADLVSLVRKGGCGGVAWLIGGGQTPIDASDAGSGFSTVHEPGCDDGLVIPHELGHNFGIDHDLETTAGNRGGAYTYAHGYRTVPPDGNGIADIMAYTAGHTKYNFYSNPNVTVRGIPLGSAADGDGARTINGTFPKIATFRPTRIFNGYRPRNDISGDGRSDLLFANATHAVASHWRMNGATVLATPPPQGTGSGSRLMASGDFHGDARADLIWMTSARALHLWRSNGSQWVGEALETPALGSQWNIAGAADLNGDGGAELLFVNQTAREFTYWVLNGTTPRYNTHYPFNAGDRLVAAGDFNADGQQDLVWQSSTHQLRLWWSNGATLSVAQSPIRTRLGPGWVVVGAGDVNGDGRSDLLFFNYSSKVFTYWLMRGATVIGYGPGTEVPAAIFSATGDFNGDGRIEVVWRRGSELFMWFGDGTKLPARITKIARPVPGDWQVSNGGVGGG